MRVASTSEMQFIVEYAQREFRADHLTSEDILVFFSWLSDDNLKTQAELGRTLNRDRRTINHSFKRLTERDFLQKTWIRGQPVKVGKHTIPQFKLGESLILYILARDSGILQKDYDFEEPKKKDYVPKKMSREKRQIDPSPQEMDYVSYQETSECNMSRHTSSPLKIRIDDHNIINSVILEELSYNYCYLDEFIDNLTQEGILYD